MTDEQKATYIQSQSTCAFIEAQAMIAANKEREDKGEAPPYDQNAFRNLLNEYWISHNATLNVFYDL